MLSSSAARVVHAAGKCRANTGATTGCASTRSSIDANAGRDAARCLRAPDQRETTAASRSSAPIRSPARNGFGGKHVGERIPQRVETRLGAASNALTRRLVRVDAEALRIVDDADRRVAVGGDVHQPAYRLRAGGGVLRQQSAGGKPIGEMDQDRRAFGEHAAFGRHQRRNLRQRIDAAQLLDSGIGLPRRRLDAAKRRTRELESPLRRRRRRTQRYRRARTWWISF